MPWGRTLEEYIKMFDLTDDDLKKKIAGFGDGPASFNYEVTERGGNIRSFDPIYQFSCEQIRNRIYETKEIVMEKMEKNKDNYIWTTIKDLDNLETIRMTAMNNFLDDFTKGKLEKRYIYHELPNQTNDEENSFDLGLSSHFLLMYTSLSFDFHIQSINEMLRICKEIRIFPIVDLDGNKTDLAKNVVDFFSQEHNVEILKTSYQFQKGGNEVLIIKKA